MSAFSGIKSTLYRLPVSDGWPSLLTFFLSALLLSILWLPQLAEAETAFLESEKRLLENQRNLFRLREEQTEFYEELRIAKLRLERLNAENIEYINTEQPLNVDKPLNIEKPGEENRRQEVLTLITELEDSIDIAGLLISNLSDTISRQRLLLATIERGSAPSTLDMAINRALNANLTELAQSLSDNEEARREVSQLRSLLKQQAGLGKRHQDAPSAVSYAAEQQLAEDEFLRLLDLLSNEDAEEKIDQQHNKAIKITGIADGTPYSRLTRLNYLGHSQYHLETPVHEGKMTFTVDGRPWHMTVPDEEHSATYIVIYDTTDTQPRLVLFNKSLLIGD